jgi:DNA helicase-2/ATP-dependent DNA helicase PcrA
VPAALDGLSPAQRAAAAHDGGPLLIVGGAGSGKTRTLVARFAWLVEQGEAPEAVLMLARSERAADALRRQVEEAIARPYEALAVASTRSREESTRSRSRWGAPTGSRCCWSGSTS